MSHGGPDMSRSAAGIHTSRVSLMHWVRSGLSVSQERVRLNHGSRHRPWKYGVVEPLFAASIAIVVF